MAKNNLYTILALTENDLTLTSEEDLISKEIKLGETFLLNSYLKYKNIAPKNNLYIDNIIKIFLPEKYDDALEMLTNGVDFKGIHYVPLVTSPSMMKSEDGEENAKCEYFFIAQEDMSFKKVFEDILSLGKLQEQEGKEICINKDIIARLALATSTTFRVDYKPNVVVLDETTYNYTANYVTFKTGTTELINKDNYTQEHTFADGCGLMSPKMAEIIQKKLEIKYPVDFAIIRLYNGLAVKGLVTKVDFDKYFTEHYRHDIEGVFEKRKDGFYTKDYFGNMVNVSKADIITTTSMAKWAKYWNSMEELEETLQDSKYDKYRYLLSCLYVTKWNKKEPNEYSLANYQLLANLALTTSDLEQLSKPTETMYKKCLNDDIDSIRLLLGDIAREEDDLVTDKEVSASTKVHYLLQSSEDFLNCRQCKATIRRVLQKSIKQLAGGKFYVKGHYKTAMADPVRFMAWIMTRDKVENIKVGLGEREYFVPKETGKRTISRNPLNSFSEIQNITLSSNEELQKYCGNLTSELLFFNQCDDTLMLCSGEDCDGDTNLVVNDEIIYNAVVPLCEGRNFINLDDGKKVPLIYNKENTYQAILKASGNLIGSLSNAGMKVCTMATDLGYVTSHGVLSYLELREEYKRVFDKEIHEKYKTKIKNIARLEKDIEQASDSESRRNYKSAKAKAEIELEKAITEDFEEKTAKQIEKGKFTKVETLPQAEQKQILINQFHKHRAESYYSLFLQMKAIDAPKTLAMPKTEQKHLKKMVKDIRKKPIFIYYNKALMPPKGKTYADLKKDYARYNCVLNKNAIRASKYIYQDYELSKNDNNKRLISTLKYNNDSEVDTELVEKIKDIYSYNTVSRQYAYANFVVEERNKEYTKIDLMTGRKMEQLITEINDTNKIAIAIVEINCTTRFIMNFCWNVLRDKLIEKYPDVSVYVKDDNAEYEWRFKKYRKEIATRKDVDLDKLDNDSKLKKLGGIFRIGVRGIITENELMDGNKVLIKKDNSDYVVISEQGEILGTMFNDKRYLRHINLLLDNYYTIQDLQINNSSFRFNLITI